MLCAHGSADLVRLHSVASVAAPSAECTLHQDTQIPSPEMPTLMRCSVFSVQAQDHTSTGLRTRCAYDMSSEGLQLILVKIYILTLALPIN